MTTIKPMHILAVCVAACAALPAAAQQQAGNAAQPQQLEKLDEGEVPDGAAPEPQLPRSIVTEKRAYGGRVTEIEVQSGGSRYYLQPNTQGGSAMPETDGRLRAPQWRIGEFDLRRSDDAQRASEAAAKVPPPPQAPAQPTK